MEITFEKAKEHSDHISNLIRSMDLINKEQVLMDIYMYVKSVTNEYYDGEKIAPEYQLIRSEVNIAEEKILSKILDVPVEFDLNDVKEKEDFFEDLIHKVREYLALKCWYFCGRMEFKDLNFVGECLNAANYVKAICDKRGITSYLLEIAPGYDSSTRLYGNDGLGFHYANIICYDGKYYLIDTTYSQFFYTSHNSLNRIGLVYIPSCNPGYFMLLNNGKDIATKIIRDGYVELDENVFKTYLDAFTISFRNGLYYENTNDFSFAAPYSIDDYIKFLRGESSQLSIEGKENLGYQKRPLKDPMMSFKRNN